MIRRVGWVIAAVLVTLALATALTPTALYVWWGVAR